VSTESESESESEYGYVWVTTWESNEDATEFRNAYRSILTARDATTPQRVESENTGSTAKTAKTTTYVIPDGSYADAFRVTQDGTQVTIVNGPNVTSLDNIRAQSKPSSA
jgi:hypothetical protein